MGRHLAVDGQVDFAAQSPAGVSEVFSCRSVGLDRI